MGERLGVGIGFPESSAYLTLLPTNLDIYAIVGTIKNAIGITPMCKATLTLVNVSLKDWIVSFFLTHQDHVLSNSCLVFFLVSTYQTMLL